jgi:hypothetical protein
MVVNSSSQPVADATIEIMSGAFAGRVTTSNAAGEFRFTDPRNGLSPEPADSTQLMALVIA